MTLSSATPDRLPQLLGALGMGTLVAGVVRHLVEPDAFDPWMARGLVAVALLALAGLMRSRLWVEMHGHLLRAVAVYGGVWMAMLVWANDFAGSYLPAVIPIASLGILTFDRLRHAVAFVAGLSLLLLAGGVHSGELGAAFGAIVSCAATGAVVLGSIGQRSALTQALVQHRAELEAEVEERTSELRREVAVRRAAEIRAMAASEAKSKFLANMSHELRTPLNAIIGYSELIREELADPDGSKKEARTDLRRVIRAADRLLNLVNDVLDLARIEADMMEILPAAMVLPDVIAEVCDEVRPLAGSRGDQILTNLSDAPPLMRSDEARIRQILVNLVTNAAKFTQDGSIVVSASAHDQTVRIDVTDDGVGIPESAMATLFDRFTQVDDSTTKVHGGTGLGLALSRDLARRMGGELFATSVPGEGSTFTLLMPIDAESTAHLRQVMESSSDDSQPLDERATLRIAEAGGA